MAQEIPDLEIIQQILSGHTGQYALLVKRHRRFVFTLALRFSKNREDAEEIAQDCFVKAYKALGAFKQTSRFSTWLYSITYTTAMTFLRKKRLDTNSIHDEAVFLELENHTSSFNATAYDRQNSHAFLDQAINQLLPDDATIITLFYKAEQSLEEIAEAMGMEASTVKVKLFRARQRLKEKLQYLLKDEVKELL